MKHLLYLLILAAFSPTASAVLRCSDGSRIWYQDTSCPVGSSSTPIVPTAPSQSAPLSGSGRIISVPQEPSTPLAPPPKHLPESALEREAQMCLDWYKKELQLPPDTRYLDFTKESRVLTINLPVRVVVSNYLGGTSENTVNKQAACEIHGGRLDDGWTRIHARRGGWMQ
ncbi:hypothetical protein [Comamonas guangdongensis]|uniref:DUF4124 domain-containing protein n=1 Tax=Comamonas guangdongensis TaxID=510515 RepID=A0ABV3ZZP1_9BURK